ncbi:MAG: DUF4097 family beta strand repeat protein [Oscillospiraceae bacterium]|nr:DUF4097 family beta strand repeat protein [Oscillospiraceae bacterium]
MKTNAIVRIVLFSIAILVLLGILITGLFIDMFQFDTSTNGQNLPVAFDGITSQGAVDADDIRNLDIEWVSGTITILHDENTNQITIAETGSENEKDAMVYSKTGNTLNIQYCKDSIKFPSFGINVNISKDLFITVPADWSCNELSIDTSSADVNIINMKINEVEFNGASGVCYFENCTVDEISMDSASGDLEFSGVLNNLEFDGASANVMITVTNIPNRIDIDSASGDLELYLPENCGFTCELTSLSGDFESNFDTVTRKGTHVHGDGSCKITVDAMSGNVSIYKQ